MLDRGDHSYIVVYDVQSASVRYISPSVDRDTLPRWSPVGKQIAFIRTPGKEVKLPLIPQHPQPWSIYVADVFSGKALKIFYSDDGMRVLWLSDDRRVQSELVDLPDWTDGREGKLVGHAEHYCQLHRCR